MAANKEKSFGENVEIAKSFIASIIASTKEFMKYLDVDLDTTHKILLKLNADGYIQPATLSDDPRTPNENTSWRRT